MNRNQSKPLLLSDNNRMLFGVCGGIAKYFERDVWMVRTFFVIGLIAFGITAFLYFIMAYSMSSSSVNEGLPDEKKVLGVCYRLARRMDWNVGMVRTIFASSLLLSLAPSFGSTLLIYFAFYFIIPGLEGAKKNPTIDDQGRRH